MSYQDNVEKTAYEVHGRSGRIGVRDLENWIEKAERILAQTDKYQKAGNIPEKEASPTGDNQDFPVLPGRA